MTVCAPLRSYLKIQAHAHTARIYFVLGNSPTNTCASCSPSFCLIGIHSSTFAYCFVGPSTWLLLGLPLRFGNCSFVLECPERFCLIVAPTLARDQTNLIIKPSRQSTHYKGLPQSSERVSPIFLRRLTEFNYQSAYYMQISQECT